ncbi:MAG: hypothetical protein ACREBR_04305 [bacterium]
MPYLKADNRLSLTDEAKVRTAICRIVSVVAPIMESSDLCHLSEGTICDDMVKIT